MKRKEVREINKKILFPAIAIALLGIALLGTQYASADDVSNPQNTLVQKIASKFGLNQDEVQKVFDEARDEHQAEMQKKHEERLNQLVTDGKITEAQKTLLLNKHKELQAEREQNRDEWQNLTPEEKRSQMETRRTELETWAKENGINVENFHGEGFMMKMGGRHGFLQ